MRKKVNINVHSVISGIEMDSLQYSVWTMNSSCLICETLERQRVPGSLCSSGYFGQGFALLIGVKQRLPARRNDGSQAFVR